MQGNGYDCLNHFRSTSFLVVTFQSKTIASCASSHKWLFGLAVEFCYVDLSLVCYLDWWIMNTGFTYYFPDKEEEKRDVIYQLYMIYINIPVLFCNCRGLVVHRKWSTCSDWQFEETYLSLACLIDWNCSKMVGENTIVMTEYFQPKGSTF